MRAKAISSLALVSLVAACESPTSTECRNVDAPVTLQLTSQTTATGTIQSGPLMGTVNAQILSTAPGANNTVTATMRHVFIASPRDTLFTNDTAVLTPTSQTEFALAETLNVERGTGRFRSASGTFTASVTGSFATGVVTGRYEGRLCGLRK